MTDLTRKSCVPCKGGEDPLDEQTIEILITQVDEAWRLNDSGYLERNVTLKNFMDVIALVNKIAVIAEEEGHHPTLRLHDYNKLTITLYTHKINGLHENDFILAAKIDEILG
jgi:4a-hydroxytetrahydrobiopterin dehydratase